MSIKHFKLGWKRCNLIECTSALTVEQTEEDCGWVHWREHKEEVARLKAEVERLTAELDQADCDYDNCQKRKVSIDNHRFDLFTENKTLKADVERLVKAGDALAETLESAGFDSAMDFWNAAKKGKPSV